VLPIILSIPDDDARDFVANIYVKYEKQLYLLSMSYLKNHYDAEDCVHNTIQKIINAIERSMMDQDTSHIEEFVTVVCRNCAINMLREKKYKNEHEQSLCRYNYEEEEYEEIDIPDYSSCVDKIYIREKTYEYLHELINKLDDRYRDVVILRSLGFDNRSIADIMNITPNLVSQRYRRAKELLLEMGGKDLYAE